MVSIKSPAFHLPTSCSPFKAVRKSQFEYMCLPKSPCPKTWKWQNANKELTWVEGEEEQKKFVYAQNKLENQ